MLQHLVLFDIDGTLISAARSGYIALEKAIVNVLRCPLGLKGIKLDGNTDTNALLQICSRDGIPFPGEVELAEFKQEYVKTLRREIAGRGHVKPGVNQLLADLAARDNVTLGLVTGNFREGAEVKLKRFDLWQYFKLGAFGCEHPKRSTLVGLAIERAKDHAKKPLLPKNVTVIGDTIHDVESCAPWGVKSLGVATGSTPLDELKTAGAHLSVESLSDTRRILDFLLAS